MRNDLYNKIRHLPSDTKLKLLVFSPFILLVLFGLYIYGSNLVNNIFDHGKFDILNTQMQSLYEKVKTASNGADDWKYMNVCSPEEEGWMDTGRFFCTTFIYLDKTVTSAKELSDLHDKYYPVFDNSDTLNKSDNLHVYFPSDFGINLAVSSAEKKYTEVKSGIECTYLINLGQSARNAGLNSNSFGAPITNGVGEMFISFRCESVARQSWYPTSEMANLLAPTE